VGYTPADYGYLSGFAYSIPFIICLLFSGTLADRFNRKMFLVTSVIIQGVTCIAYGFIKKETKNLLYAIRIVQGICSAFNAPFAYSIIGDVFDDE
jgi:MFS family permease